MLSWLFKDQAPVLEVVSSTEKEASLPKGFIAPQLAHELLNTPRRQKLLAHIWQRTSISRKQFDLLYLTPIQRYAALVQQFPASESHHHAYPGGMLDHGLEIMAYALKLRQSYLLPIGSTPEEQAAQSESWSAGIAYAALLHDIGKIAVDLHVEYENDHVWHPWHGCITKPYRFRYRQDREYRLHSAGTGILYHQILDASIMDWLSQTPPLWSALLYVLAGQFEHAGILGEIVTKADQASVAQELGGDPAKAMSAPKHALQRKLLDGLRYLVKEELKLNNAGPSDGWLTEDALWLVSKTVSDKLRAHLLSQGVSGIPEKNSAIFDVLQEHSIILATPENKAIWNATINSESGWGSKFTFLKVSPALIWETGDRPEAFTGAVRVLSEVEKTAAVVQNNIAVSVATPDVNTAQLAQNPIESAKPDGADNLDAVLDILGLHSHVDAKENQPVTNTVKNAGNETPVEVPAEAAIETPVPEQKQPAVPAPAKAVPADHPVLPAGQQVPVSFKHGGVEPSGEHFMQWLKEAVLSKKLIINDAHALVHTVAETVYLVTPGIFERYAQEFPAVQALAKEEGVKEFRWVQKRFEKLKLHKKHPGGFNIWTCTVKGPRKTRLVHGYLLAEPQTVLPEIPFNNPFLILSKNND